MTAQMEKRACELAVYIIETEATVRMAAQHFGVSKSTVHKDIAFRLRQLNRGLIRLRMLVARVGSHHVVQEFAVISFDLGEVFDLAFRLDFRAVAPNDAR